MLRQNTLSYCSFLSRTCRSGYIAALCQPRRSRNQTILRVDRMSPLGQSRPGRGNSKSSHVRYAAEGGSRFGALAVTHRNGGLISYDGISCSPLFFGSCRGPGWVPHERERTQKIANYRRKKPRENKGVLLIQTAHNGLVAGSSPAGPTNESTTYRIFISSAVDDAHAWGDEGPKIICEIALRLSVHHPIPFRPL